MRCSIKATSLLRETRVSLATRVNAGTSTLGQGVAHDRWMNLSLQEELGLKPRAKSQGQGGIFPHCSQDPLCIMWPHRGHAGAHPGILPHLAMTLASHIQPQHSKGMSRPKGYPRKMEVSSLPAAGIPCVAFGPWLDKEKSRGEPWDDPCAAT